MLTELYRHSDADPRDFSTIFGFSSVPEFFLHLILQRTDDNLLLPSCAATVLPAALRPSIHEDLLARYETMSFNRELVDLVFPNLGFQREIPDDIRALIVNDLIREQSNFINHI